MYLVEFNLQSDGLEKSKDLLDVCMKNGHISNAGSHDRLNSSEYSDLLKYAVEFSSDGSLLIFLYFLKSSISEVLAFLKGRAIKVKKKNGDEFEISGVVDIEKMIEKLEEEGDAE